MLHLMALLHEYTNGADMKHWNVIYEQYQIMWRLRNQHIETRFKIIDVTARLIDILTC